MRSTHSLVKLHNHIVFVVVTVAIAAVFVASVDVVYGSVVVVD